MATQTSSAAQKHQHLPVDAAQVFIVIPAYNEAARLGPVLDALLPQYPNVVVVDDGSSDETAQVARQRGAVVLRHVINRGQGAALQTGITYSLRAGAEYIVTFDADGQHNPADLPAMLAPVAAGQCDVTLGSRFLGRAENMPLSRRLLLLAARVFTYLTSGVKLTDTTTGLRVLSRRAAQCFRFRQDRMAYAAELFDQMRQASLTYREVPVTMVYTSETLAKGQRNRDAISVAFHYLFGKVRQ